MQLFQYLGFAPYNYCGLYQPMTPDEDLVETLKNRNDVTDIPPPTNLPDSPFIKLCFNVEQQVWELKELYNPLIGSNTLDDVLTYADVRQLEYPPESEYVDAQVKNDEQQLRAYLQKCAEVKLQYPKTMQPITRRQYYQLKYPLFKSDQQTPVIEKVDVPLSDCQPLLSVTNKVNEVQTNLQTLHAFDVLILQQENTKLKNELADLQHQLKTIRIALEKKFII